MSGLSSRQRAFAYEAAVKNQKKEHIAAGRPWSREVCEFGPDGLRCDGNECKGELCVDHIDNDNKNNPKNGSNWQLLCRGHNGRKNNGRKRKDRSLLNFKELEQSIKRVREKDKGIDIEEVKVSTVENEKNKRCMPTVVQFVRAVIEENAEVILEDLCHAASYMTMKEYGAGNGVDPQTVKRYVRILAAPWVGEYELYKKQNRNGRDEVWVRVKRHNKAIV